MAHTSDKTPVLAIQRIWIRRDKTSLIKAIADQSILHSNDEFWGCLQKKPAHGLLNNKEEAKKAYFSKYGRKAYSAAKKRTKIRESVLVGKSVIRGAVFLLFFILVPKLQ